ncbi:peptidylprolyl isomerase [Odoribacter lunatus]|uniref:peptidylprolyl isomerase n=1 Tax=Odoribacter lunatus TaxID=2941335 RepID=UPI00203C6C5B|nr:SurA N-terminal domain-containing protein [Odoribacter lunatus]
MATLQTIRNRGGLLVSIVIGLALVAFIVGDALSSGASIFNSSRNEVGEIAGESISIMDYQNKITRNEEMVKMMNGTSALNDEQQTMLRENTWQQMVMDIVMNQEYDELGINVSGDELYDMLLGDNMNPSIRQMFGNADPNQIRSYVKSLMELPANNPQKAYWLNLEEQIITTRKQAKYNNLIAKALYTTAAEAEEMATNSAAKADISYIVKNYTSIEDSTIQVSNSEIKNYYDSHKKLFEQPESRKIVYVNFDVEPSGTDYAETEKWVEKLIPEFAETENPQEFVDLSSDQKFDAFYYKKSEINNDSLADFLFNRKNNVYGPYIENNSYRISRVADRKMLPDSVRARHILIAPENNNYAQAKAVADSLTELLKKGADFETLAKKFSTDQNSAVNGGDLGWFGPRMMVQPFSDTVFFSKAREIKVVLTQFGAHIVQVTDRAKPVEKIQIATVEKEIIPSQTTINKVYNEARSFADKVNDLTTFDKKVTEFNLNKRIASLNKNDKNIAGMENAREVIRQAYLANTPGKVLISNEGTNIFDAGNKFTVAVLTDIQEEGIAPVNNIANTIKRELIRKKKAEILEKELQAAIDGSESLLSIAQKAGLEIKDASEISFNSFQVPGAGIEPNVIALASQLEQGQISKPIAGNQGIYIIMINNKIVEETTPETVEQAKTGIDQSNKYRATYQAVQALLKNAEVKDLRYKFY